MSVLARPLGSPPITAEQRIIRALPPIALPVPTLLDAVLDLQPLRYSVALPLTEPTRDPGLPPLQCLTPAEVARRVHLEIPVPGRG